MFAEGSNLALICTNQTIFVDESSAAVTHTFPVKHKSSGTFNLFSIISNIAAIYYSLIVNWSYLNFVQPDHNFGKASS